MLGRCSRLMLAASCACLLVAGEKLTEDQRIALIRGLSAEYATAKVGLPRSKKDLEIDKQGKYDKRIWDDAGRQFGPAARTGDLVHITKIDIDNDKIVFQINGGFKAGRKKWYEHVQVGMGTQTAPISRGDGSNAPGGTAIALLFPGGVPSVKPDEIKKMLAPVLDFEKRTATQTYMETLPPEVQQAVKEKRVLEGMDRDQVLLAVGKPVRKVRNIEDGTELEDWIYGAPPGKITFVTFSGNKVVKVKEDYAGLGTAAPPIQPPR